MGDTRLRELERTWLRSGDPADAACYRTQLFRAYPGLIVEVGTLAVRLVHLSGWEGFGQDDDDAWLAAQTPRRLLELGGAVAPLVAEELVRLECAELAGCQRVLTLMQSSRKPPEDPTPRAWSSALELSRSKLLPSEGRLEAALGRIRFLIHDEELVGPRLPVLLRSLVVRQLGSQRDPYPDHALLEAAAEARGEACRAYLEVGRSACGWPQASDDLDASLQAVRSHMARQPYLLELGLPGQTAEME